MGVPRDSRIGVRFDRPMNVGSVAERMAIDPPVAGPWNAEGNLVYIQPIEPLLPGQTYKVTLSGGATSIEGVPSMQPTSWSFTVAEPYYGQLPILEDLPPLSAVDGVRALAFGPDGVIYAASETEVVRLVPEGDGYGSETISTGWTAIEDIATDKEGAVWLAVAEKGDYRLVRLDETGQAAATLPIGQPDPLVGANWFYPRSLAFSPEGDLLLLGTDRVRQIDPATGEVKQDLGVGALSGAVTEGYFGPSGLAVDVEAGVVYVDNGYEYGQYGGIVGLALADGKVVEAHTIGTDRYSGLARDAWGNFYLVSQSAEPRHLRVFGPDGAPLDNLIEAPEQDASGWAPELAVWEGVLYVVDSQTGSILRFALSSSGQ